MNEYFIKRPLPQWWLTALLIGINVLLFLIEVLSGVSLFDPSMVDLIKWGADFTPLTLSSEPWRLLSSMFLHIGFVHLSVNMWALYLFGLYAEFYYGRWFYLLIYLSAGIAGNLFSNFLSIHQMLPHAATGTPLPMSAISGGASGAIMGVGGALLIASLWPRPDLPAEIRLNKNSLIMLMLLNLGIGFIVAGINNAAHLGGFIMGAVLALLFRTSMVLPAMTGRIMRLLLIPLCILGLSFCYQILLKQAQPLHAVWQMIIF